MNTIMRLENKLNYYFQKYMIIGYNHPIVNFQPSQFLPGTLKA